MVATPIMRWLRICGRPGRSVQPDDGGAGPGRGQRGRRGGGVAGVAGPACHVAVRVDDDGAGGWALQVPEAGSVDAGGCLQTVDVLSEEALVAARSRLNPARRGDAQRAVGVATGQLVLIVHHLAVDGVSWRILLEDLNIAWAQHRSGQPIALPAAGTSFARWSALLAEHAVTPRWWPTPVLAAGGGDSGGVAGGATGGGHVRDGRAVVGGTGCRDHADALGEVPAAFHAGVQDILLIAFGLAVAEFSVARRADRHRRGGPRPRRGVGRRCGSDAHGGMVHHQVSGVADRRRLAWAQVAAGEAALGRGGQGGQGAAARPARRVDLRSAAVSEPRRRAGRVRSGDRVQLSGPARRGGRSSPRICGGSARTGWR